MNVIIVIFISSIFSLAYSTSSLLAYGIMVVDGYGSFLEILLYLCGYKLLSYVTAQYILKTKKHFCKRYHQHCITLTGARTSLLSKEDENSVLTATMIIIIITIPFSLISSSVHHLLPRHRKTGHREWNRQKIPLLNCNLQ